MTASRRTPQPVWYSVLAILVSMLTVAGSTVYLSARSDQRSAESDRRSAETARISEQKWCSLITTMDDAYRSTPPTTEIGRKLAQDIGDLRVQFGCPVR